MLCFFPTSSFCPFFSLTDAELQLSKSPEERLSHMKELFERPRSALSGSPSSVASQGSRKRKREADTDSEADSDPKKARLSSIEQLVAAIDPDRLEAQRRKLKTGFKLFQLANHDRVAREGGTRTGFGTEMPLQAS